MGHAEPWIRVQLIAQLNHYLDRHSESETVPSAVRRRSHRPVVGPRAVGVLPVHKPDDIECPKRIKKLGVKLVCLVCTLKSRHNNPNVTDVVIWVCRSDLYMKPDIAWCDVNFHPAGFLRNDLSIPSHHELPLPLIEHSVSPSWIVPLSIVVHKRVDALIREH